jgi:GTP cyclohydrolase I
MFTLAKINLTNKEVQTEALRLATEILSMCEVSCRSKPFLLRVFGIPRGGVPVAYLLVGALNACPDVEAIVVDDPAEADLLVDDLIDSGATQARWAEKYPNKPFWALFDKRNMKDKPWLVFPWEASEEKSAEDIPVRLLQYIGEDPKRGGLVETPHRMLKAWQFYTQGYHIDPVSVLKTFEDGAENCDEMVLVKNIPIYSHCEHHLAPFFGTVSIAYIPNGKVVGLSKLARLAEIFARRLQVQERLTNQIADALMEHLKAKGCGVIIECRHMCMEARGICKQGSTTVTSALRGVMKTDPSARAEFLSLTNKG